jgi:8-oxo-dGTP diphosphatase
MKRATICFPIRGSRILLGMKKHRLGVSDFGVGKWNGFGGKQEHDEPMPTVASRELAEECGLIAAVKDLEDVATIAFFGGDSPFYDCTIFLVRSWQGVPRESDEMRPQWFYLANIPYDDMWSGDRFWLPLVLAGKKFDGTLRFKPDLKEVASFDFVERAVG